MCIRDSEDSGSYADWRERATPQGSRWARANEQVAASKPRGGGDTARRKSENILRISRTRPGRRVSEIGNSLAGPGRRRVGLESHRPGRAWARDLKVSPAGPGAGWTSRGRPRPARPHLRELAPPAKIVGFEALDFLQFESITKRDIKRGISATLVRNEVS